MAPTTTDELNAELFSLADEVEHLPRPIAAKVAHLLRWQQDIGDLRRDVSSLGTSGKALLGQNHSGSAPSGVGPLGGKRRSFGAASFLWHEWRWRGTEVR